MVNVIASNATQTYLHFTENGNVDTFEADQFWQGLAEGRYPQLDNGRVMTSYTFDANWPTWELHPEGDELVMLINGAVRLLLELDGGVQTLHLNKPGDFALVPRNVWHTAHTEETTTMLFLTSGKNTEHRPAV
jgi:uncharacterized cupin superfamily protein